MNMGEVIKANFGGDRKEKPEEPVGQPEQPIAAFSKETVLENFEDTRYVIENFDRIGIAGGRIAEITDFIFDKLIGYTRDDESIKLRREGLREASMESLVGYLVDSNESDWKVHPSFYGAVILEYDERAQQVISFIGSDDEPA